MSTDGTQQSSLIESPGSIVDKKIVKTSPVLWILGFVFFGVLTALFSRALYDIQDFFPQPVSLLLGSTSPKLKQLELERTQLLAAPDLQQQEINLMTGELENLSKQLQTVESNY